jgi:beta-lactamase class A
MNNKPLFPFLRWISLLLILIAITITTLEIKGYRQAQVTYPEGSVIASIPVGGLDHAQASQRVAQAYLEPVEVHYALAVFLIDPPAAGFNLDLESMLAAADARLAQPSFWQGFWDYLWEKPRPSVSIPLEATFSKDQLHSYLVNEIETRYDHPPTPPFPLAGTPTFQPGVPGTTLNIDQAETAISNALFSPTQRIVNMTFNQADPPGPSLVNLPVLMQQIIQLAQFKGIVEVYFTDLRTSENFHFVYDYVAKTPPPLNIAFSGWSTIKIPIMIAAMRRLAEPIPDSAMNLLQNMIELSDNTAADRLAQTVIDQYLAPVLVTQDMQTLGLKNTFWGGFFYPGAPLLRRYNTPANTRTDVNTGPDPYDQTSPADLGMLLEDIYECSQTGGGALAAAFPGEITQTKCQQMIELLEGNDIPQLIQAGLPFGTPWAHKHGWADEYPDGLIHTMCDAGIAYTPGGNFVIVVFVHDPVQVVFDPVNAMVAHLGAAAYNFFNPPKP